MTPLGKALKDSMEEMEIDSNLKSLIEAKYVKAIEEEFKEIGSQQKSSNPPRCKFTGKCKTYNNMYQVWHFDISSFELYLDERKKYDVPTSLISIPHTDFQMRHTWHNNRKK